MSTFAASRQLSSAIGRAIPPHAYFLVSAIFHYLGPAMAVLLFEHVAVMGVAWLRIASAAVIFAAWRRPWKSVNIWSGPRSVDVVALGVTLALMNGSFYLAIARLPLGTVGAIEFLGPVALAAFGVRGWRNLVALMTAVAGVALLTNVRLEGELVGFGFAFLNCAFFTTYIVLGHRLAQHGGPAVDRLAAAMMIAVVVITPFGFKDAAPAIGHVDLLLAGLGVGVCSSVVPYVCDQLAMARLPRATFALLFALLPASAVIIGLIVLGQRPQLNEVVAVGLVVLAIGLHDDARH